MDLNWDSESGITFEPYSNIGRMRLTRSHNQKNRKAGTLTSHLTHGQESLSGPWSAWEALHSKSLDPWQPPSTVQRPRTKIRLYDRQLPRSSLRAVGNDHFCDATKRASQRLSPQIKGEIPEDITEVGIDPE